MKEFAELQEVINKADWKAMHEYFGCHFSATASPEDLDEKADKMIRRCKVWIENWSAVRKGVAPKVEEERTKRLDSTAEKLKTYTPDQLKALYDLALKKSQEANVA